MTSRDFAYWLQGFFEISDTNKLNEKQVDMIKNHLNLVFFHEIDPSMTPDKKKQQLMNQIHHGKNPNETPAYFHHMETGGILPSEDQVLLRC